MALLLASWARGALPAMLGVLCLVATACTVIDSPDGSADPTAAPPAQASLVAAVGNEAVALLAQAIGGRAGVPRAIDAAAGASSLDAPPAAVEPFSPQQPATTAPATVGWNRATADTSAAGTPTAAHAAPSVQTQSTAATRPVQLYKGVATYYGADFDGKPMASGPIYHMMDPTITASNFWPLGTRLRIWRVPGGPWDGLLSPEERAYFFGHSITVTVLDRGAFSHALDLSYGAFSTLGRPSEGVIAVYIQPLDGTAPSR